jgi:hypothetical protein
MNVTALIRPQPTRQCFDDLEAPKCQEAESRNAQQKFARGLMLQFTQHARQTQRFLGIGIVGGKAQKSAHHEEYNGARQDAERPERDRPGTDQ